MLAVSRRIAEHEERIGELQGPSPSPFTPSGVVPIYTKPNASKQRQKPGAREGHPGHRRKPPARIDEHSRPAVILRKNSLSNRLDQGAATQAVLISVYRALRLRGHDPTKTITNALKTYLTTG